MKKLEKHTANKLIDEVFQYLFDKKNGTHEIDLDVDGVAWFITGDWYKHEDTIRGFEIYEDSFKCTELFSLNLETDDRTHFIPSDINFETRNKEEI